MLAVGSGGIVWLAAIFFFPFVLVALTVLVLLPPVIHWHLRRKGVAKFAVAPAGWQTYISECASKVAGQLNLPRAPILGITGEIGDIFKHLFPNNGYILLPSDLVASPINNLSVKLMSDLVKYQLVHGALSQHGVWEEAFFLAMRPMPFLYAGYRRVCDLSVDRMMSFLSENEDEPDNHALPGKSRLLAGIDERSGVFAYRLRRLYYCLYSLRPAFDVRIRELRRYQSRIDRREKAYGMMRRTMPGADQVIGGRKGLWRDRLLTIPNGMKALIQGLRWTKKAAVDLVGPDVGRRHGLAGPVIGVIIVCIAALFIFSSIDEMLNLKGLSWDRKSGREEHPSPKPNLTETREVGVLPLRPESQETISGSEPQKEALELRDVRRKAPTRPADEKDERSQKSRFTKPTIIEVSANSALRNGGHKGIRAIVTQDGDLALVGSTSSSQQKKLAFRAVKSLTKTGRIRDLVYVVEE